MGLTVMGDMALQTNRSDRLTITSDAVAAATVEQVYFIELIPESSGALRGNTRTPYAELGPPRMFLFLSDTH
jgi:hypothetical protein